MIGLGAAFFALSVYLIETEGFMHWLAATLVIGCMVVALQLLGRLLGHVP